MALSLIGTPSNVHATSGSVTSAWGTGQAPAAGDLLAAVVHGAVSTAAARTITTGSAGWSLLKDSDNRASPAGSGTALAFTAIFTKTAAGSDAAPAFALTASGTTAMDAELYIIRSSVTGATVTLDSASTGSYSSGTTSGSLTAMTAASNSTVTQVGEIAVYGFSQERTATSVTWTDGGSTATVTVDVNGSGVSSVLGSCCADIAGFGSGVFITGKGSFSTRTSAFGSGVIAAWYEAAPAGTTWTGAAALAGSGTLSAAVTLGYAAALSGSGSLTAAAATSGGGGIAFDTAGATAMTAGVTSASVDITAAATGSWAYLWADLPAATTTPANAGWAQLAATADTVVTVQYAVLRRRKQAGDTTFTFTWTGAGKGVFAWASYLGLDGTTPDEGAAITFNASVSRSAVPTPSATPTAANRWALAFFGVRTSTSGNQNIDWTPDAATAERSDVNNSAAASAAWTGTEIADTAGPVIQAAHSYTATHNVSGTPANEGHDGSAILFLVPAAGGVTHGGAASLSGSGSLTAAAALGYAAALTGTGTVTQTAALGYAAALAGAGALTAAVTLRYAAVLGGSGTLAVTGAQLGYSAALSGAGTLTAAAALGYAAALSGSGTLAAAAGTSGQHPAAAVLSGAGTLTQTVTLAYAASLSGAGTLAGTTALGYTAALAGTGTLTAAVTLRYTAALTGQGVLTGAVTLRYAAALSGSGSLTAAGAISGQHAAAAVLSGAGSLAAADVTLAYSAALTGSGTLAGAVTLRYAAALSGQGSLTAAWAFAGAAALSGTGTLAVPGVRLGYAAALTGSGTLAAAVTLRYAAALAGVGVLTAAAQVIIPAVFGTATATGTAVTAATPAGAQLATATAGGGQLAAAIPGGQP